MQSLQSFAEWLAQPSVSSGASLVALLAGALSFLKIRGIRRSIQRDRDFLQQVLSLHEVYFHLGQALKYLEASIERPRIRQQDRQPKTLPVFNGLRDSKKSLEMFFEFVHGAKVTGAKALLQGARLYRKTGRIEQAVIHYEKAIEQSPHCCEFTEGDLAECYLGLQRCCLALWDVEEAIRITREAGARSISECIPEAKIRRYFLPLCAGAFLKITVLRLWCLLDSRRSQRVQTLTRI
jgi:tetratricopeptide (TPR) repeat protein